MEEKAIERQDLIAEYMGISRRTLCRKIPHMREVGAILYKIKRAKNGGKQKVCYSFPSLLQRFLILENTSKK
jgi:predicted transcriptional regulator